MKPISRLLSVLAAAALMAPGLSTTAHAAAKKEFNIARTIYVGWMPWPYAADSGIVKKWADKYGITINITQINDYVESINQYTAGKFDGVTLTNMDALTIPAAGGVDTSAIIMGDFSNGNDGIVLKNAKALGDIKGRKINIVELSVSHYLLARGLASIRLREKDIKTINTSDADIVAAFKSPDSTAVVTWNPQLMEVKAEPKATLVFDSSKIPGEIQDLMGINTDTLKDNPNLGKALVGIWYETIALLQDQGDKGKAAREAMAKASGTDLAQIEGRHRHRHAGRKSRLQAERQAALRSDLHEARCRREALARCPNVKAFCRSHGRACPGHPRLSWLKVRKKDVDARDKRGHDGGVVIRYHQNCSRSAFDQKRRDPPFAA